MKPKPVENCPICGRLMNLMPLNLQHWNCLLACEGETKPYKHATTVLARKPEPTKKGKR